MIARKAEKEWGRVNASRRMGNLLRLIGTVLAEITLHEPRGNARQLLSAQARYNWDTLGFAGKRPTFYDQFVAARSEEEDIAKQFPVQPLTKGEVRRVIDERQKSAKRPSTRGSNRSDPTPSSERERELEREALLRVGVLSAARDIQRIFEYLRANPSDGIRTFEDGDLDRDLRKIEFQSPLFRISGHDPEDSTCFLPLAEFYLNIVRRQQREALSKPQKQLMDEERGLEALARELRTISEWCVKISAQPALLPDALALRDARKQFLNFAAQFQTSAEKISGVVGEEFPPESLDQWEEFLGLDLREAQFEDDVLSPETLGKLQTHLSDQCQKLAGICDAVVRSAEQGAHLRREEVHLRNNLRLLLLAEQAHISSFINYRDSIPDYGYASSVLATAELYMVALHHVGLAGCAFFKNSKPSPEERKRYRDAFLTITDVAKRYIVKAIDTLKRERDQNRNTFHLMSEAHFNLGDLLLIRLAALPHRDEEGHPAREPLCPRLFGFEILQPDDALPTQDDPEPFGGDKYPEDLRRQVWAHYREGILLVQAEMEELFGRYRLPPDVFHAHRNIMDPILHHRISKAARMRHVATRPYNHSSRSAQSQRPTGYDPTKYDEYWDRLCQQITYSAPPSLSNHDWLEELESMLKMVNGVRSDRGPLRIVIDHENQDAPRYVEWIPTKQLEKQKQIVLFFESYVRRNPPGSD